MQTSTPAFPVQPEKLSDMSELSPSIDHIGDESIYLELQLKRKETL